MKDKKKIIGSIIVVVLFILCIIIGYKIPKGNINNNGDDIFVDNNDNATTKKNSSTLKKDDNSLKKDMLDDVHKKIHVYVRGAIKEHKPYSIIMDYGSLYEDAVKASGGLETDADLESPLYTPQKKLKEEDLVYVPKKGENISQATGVAVVENKNGVSVGKIDLNTASEDEIVAKKIPRIGKATAAKIIKYRESNGGRLKSMEELKKVVGNKTAENIMEYAELN